MKICGMCGRPAECRHHLVFGNGMRNLAEEDNLVLDLCNACHNMGNRADKIHGNSAAESLSKMLGQMMWERDYMAELLGSNQEEIKEDIRDRFRRRYGRSYL